MGDWNSGDDAAYIKPKFIPKENLMPRDDSGGPDYTPHSGDFGQAGYVKGPKAHLGTGKS